MITGLSEPWGQGGQSPPPQKKKFLAVNLLSTRGRGIFCPPHNYWPPHPDFQTFLRPWMIREEEPRAKIGILFKGHKWLLIGLLWWPNEPFYLSVPNKIWGARNKTARKMAKRNDAGDLPIVCPCDPNFFQQGLSAGWPSTVHIAPFYQNLIRCCL